MHDMWIKVGEHEGVSEYSPVSISDPTVVRGAKDIQEFFEDGYVIVYFKHIITQVDRMARGTVPVVMAYVREQ